MTLRGLTCGFVDIAEYGEFGVVESASAMEDNVLDGLGYTIEDLSGDGIPELVVGTLTNYGGQINAAYTLVDGKPQFVLEGWYRSSYSYLGNGCFYYYGSGGASKTGQGFFYLSRDGATLNCEDFYFTHAAEEDYPCAAFVDCEIPSAPSPVSAGNAYDERIQRYRQIVADPDDSSAETAGERCVLTAARDMREWDENPLTALGYAVEDLSGDGVPELMIGFLPDHSIFQYAVTIYHNTTGSLDPVESELNDWTMEYFYAWEPEYEDLPMILFSTD